MKHVEVKVAPASLKTLNMGLRRHRAWVKILCCYLGTREYANVPCCIYLVHKSLVVAEDYLLFPLIFMLGVYHRVSCSEWV